MKKAFARKLSAFLLVGGLVFGVGCAKLDLSFKKETKTNYQLTRVSDPEIIASIERKVMKRLDLSHVELYVEETEFTPGRKSYFVTIKDHESRELLEKSLPIGEKYTPFTLYYPQTISESLLYMWEGFYKKDMEIKKLTPTGQKVLRMAKKDLMNAPYINDKEMFVVYNNDINNPLGMFSRATKPHERGHEISLEPNLLKEEIRAHLEDLEREGYEYLDLGGED